ncbi:transmembrane 9 superfamily member 11-like protein [Tanacetum coccineum]|uniref:Transmembrane 9 superfamily member 11-like protein n=1 Tax=Tanacetum coccineum TaxID=301880 RepID=A0ABQ4Y4M5_9ASTR
MKSGKETVKIRVCKGEAVSERLEIDDNSGFMVTYILDNDILEVCDDLDVHELMEFVVKSSRIVTLCIVESSVNGRQSSTTESNQQSNFIYATPFSGNPMYVPGFPRYHMQDPQSDLANRKKTGSVLRKVKILSGEDKSSESNDESSESDEDTETTLVENKSFKEDKFWIMPPILKTPVLDIKKKDMCYGTSSLVRLHATFDSKEEIKIVLGRKALEEGFQIRYPRSDPQRVYAKCIVDTCEWIFQAYIPKDYKKFYVTAFVDHHTCTKTQIHPHHRNASPKVLGHILKEVMSESSRIYRGKEIMTDMKARFKIDISYSQAWRAKCYALHLLRGTPEESFAELPLYCHNLKLKNQGTITHIETDDEDRFEIFFLPSVLRPLIIIDGAYLKDEFLGTMYLAVAVDDNLTIISDGAVSIASAIKNVFPNAFHGRCCRHLLMNLREKCPLFISKEELFWKACKAYRISDFEERFSTLRDLLPSVANKLDMIGLEKWARVHFPDEHKHELTPWAEAKLAQRIAKSATWTVRPAANYLYNVVDYYKNRTIDLNTRTCSCGQWQLPGLPCGHLIAVM